MKAELGSGNSLVEHNAADDVLKCGIHGRKTARMQSHVAAPNVNAARTTT